MADWAPGDLAMCIKGGPWIGWHSSFGSVEAPGPRQFSIHQVERVEAGRPPAPEEPFLGFAEFGAATYLHSHFRKVPPLEPDADEFVISAYRGEGLPEPLEVGVDWGRPVDSVGRLR